MSVAAVASEPQSGVDQEDAAYSAARLRSLSVVEKLEGAVGRAVAREDGRQILNRSQQRYEFEEQGIAKCDREGAELDNLILRGEDAMKEMELALDLMRRNRDDISALRESHVDAVSALRRRGVKMPD